MLDRSSSSHTYLVPGGDPLSRKSLQLLSPERIGVARKRLSGPKDQAANDMKELVELLANAPLVLQKEKDGHNIFSEYVADYFPS